MHHLLGAMSRKLAIFINFRKGKIRSHGIICFFGFTSWGAMLRKLAIFNSGKYVHMVAFFGIISWGRCWNTNFFRQHGGAMWREMTIFKGRKRLCKGANVFRVLCAWRRCKDNLNEMSGGDLDEVIDFQSPNSRDLWYVSRTFLELVMHGYTILNGGDLDENCNSKDGKLVMHG